MMGEIMLLATECSSWPDVVSSLGGTLGVLGVLWIFFGRRG